MGGWDGAIISFCAATVAMYARQTMAHNLIHPLINFCITAFISTSISDFLLQRNYFHSTPSVAMAASLLLLVPGFPLINALSDMFKGNVNTGIDRWVTASLMTLATCIGVIFSLSVFGGGGWIPFDLSH